MSSALAPFPKRAFVLAYGVLSYLIGVLALLVWIASMFGVVHFSGGTLATGPALAVDLALVLAFGLQHSVMARPAFKKRWLRVVGPALERPSYVLATGLVFLPVLWLWQPMPALIWRLEHPIAVVLSYAMAGGGWAYLFLATFAIDHFELFGLRQVWSFFMGRAVVPVEFRERWMYRFDRHPIMTGALIGMWATPSMTLGHLVFAIAFSIYIVVGVYFEERSMRAQWGGSYDDYRSRVGTIVPNMARPPAVPREPSTES